MNNVIISGIVKGKFTQIKDSQHFILSQKGRDGESVDFNMVAHGETAERLVSNVESGQRIVVQGRLSSEKLFDDTYHNVISIARILADEVGSGMDYSNIIVTAEAKCSEVKKVGQKQQSVANLDLSVKREFKNAAGEVKSYTSYFSASVWGERADALEASLPMVDQNVFISGTLRPRQYTKTTGELVNRIDIWVDELELTNGTPITSVPQKYDNAETKPSTKPAATRASTKRAPAVVIDEEDTPF